MKTKRIIAVILVLLSLFAMCACEVKEYEETQIIDIDGDTEKQDSQPTVPPNSVDENQSRFDVYIKSTANNVAINSSIWSETSVDVMDKNDCLPYLGIQEGFYISQYLGQTVFISTEKTELFYIEKGSESAEAVIEVAKSLLGYPYVWGSIRYLNDKGKVNNSFVYGEFDCSALTQYAYYIGMGIKLNATTRTQVTQGEKISFENIRRGDLLFFSNASRYYYSGIERIGHVAIYLGSDYIIHTSSDHAVIEPLTPTRLSYYITARRFF